MSIISITAIIMTKSDGQKAVELHLAEALTWAGARPLDLVQPSAGRMQNGACKKSPKTLKVRPIITAERILVQSGPLIV